MRSGASTSADRASQSTMSLYPTLAPSANVSVLPDLTPVFEREVHAVAALNHPNICTIYDVGPNYLVMELVEGPTLAERIKHGAISLEEALPIVRQIIDALEAAHVINEFTHRIVSRDWDLFYWGYAHGPAMIEFVGTNPRVGDVIPELVV